MRKLTFIIMLLLAGVSGIKAQKMSFTVAGPEETYNQIRVVNETSETDFTCRVVVVLGENDEASEVFGVFNLKEHGDHDAKTKWLKRGTKLVLEMPNDFPENVTMAIEYLDRPLFDIVVIHLTNADAFDSVK